MSGIQNHCNRYRVPVFKRSPSLGRFLQVDHIGYEEYMNLYAYVKNDPLTLADPSGECSTVRDRNGQTRRIGLCGNSAAANNLITSVNNSGYQGLRDLDREATQKGVLVSVDVVDDGLGSGYQADNPRDAGGGPDGPGRGSGGTITIDLRDRSNAVQVSTVQDLADGVIDGKDYRHGPHYGTGARPRSPACSGWREWSDRYLPQDALVF